MDKEHLRRTILKIVKKSKFIYNSIEWLRGCHDIKNQRMLFSIYNVKKDKVTIQREKRIIREYWHCGTYHYYRYGLPYLSLSDEELLDYVPTFYHHKKLERDHTGIDTVYYGDKLIQAHLFTNRAIPTADVIAYKKGNLWYKFNNNHEIDIIPLIEKTLKSGNEKLFLKPTGGQGGSGIFVLKRRDKEFIVNGEPVELAKFIHHISNTDFILQKGLVQSIQMMEINPSSVNTLRVVVQKEGQQMKMKTCIIRMGRQGKEVDNSAQGGISVKVDIETGNVAQTATAEHGGGILTCHPDTNKVFKDITINNWEQLKGEIEEIGTKLIDFRNIALDIAVTEEGAKLLEFNFRYGIEHQQCVLGGVRKVLNIYPD